MSFIVVQVKIALLLKKYLMPLTRITRRTPIPAGAYSFQLPANNAYLITTLCLDSAKVVGFIPTKDFPRAKSFYTGKLGLRFVAEDDFAMVFETGGTTIRVVKVKDFEPAGFTILGWAVGDIQESVASLSERGIVFERYPWMKQDASGIWTAPGGARVVWFKDPDGNVLSVSSR